MCSTRAMLCGTLCVLARFVPRVGRGAVNRSPRDIVPHDIKPHHAISLIMITVAVTIALALLIILLIASVLLPISWDAAALDGVPFANIRSRRLGVPHRARAAWLPATSRSACLCCWLAPCRVLHATWLSRFRVGGRVPCTRSIVILCCYCLHMSHAGGHVLLTA